MRNPLLPRSLMESNSFLSIPFQPKGISLSFGFYIFRSKESYFAFNLNAINELLFKN